VVDTGHRIIAPERLPAEEARTVLMLNPNCYQEISR
jgi:hypothetical protein